MQNNTDVVLKEHVEEWEQTTRPPVKKQDGLKE